jgi:NTE family protein
MGELRADLVLEGGGVKGIGLVGAYSVIEERGYKIERVAGTSAGSIVGALLAAGLSAADLESEMRRLDYTKFRDPSLLDRVPLLGKPMSLLFEQGIYEGNYAHTWVQEHLAERGVHTFAQLPYDDPDYPLEPVQRYRLVVMASDVTRGCLRKFPWEYARYGCRADDQLVADAVRASMSIPFFFEPVRLRDQKLGRDCTLLDGGMLSNFPVGVFDADGREPRWPTFGIKLSSRQSLDGTICDVHGPISLTVAMIRTMTSFYDRLHVDDPAVQDRTIFVDTGSVNATDFELSAGDRDLLFAKGRDAATKFFDGDEDHSPWDWEAYKAKYRGPKHVRRPATAGAGAG